MRVYALIAVLLLLCAAVSPSNTLPPPPSASSFMESLGGFFSGLLEFLGLSAPAEKSSQPDCTVNAIASPAGRGMVDGAGEYPCGNTISLNAYPVSGWEVSGFESREEGCTLYWNGGRTAVLKIAPKDGSACGIKANFANASAKGNASATAGRENVRITEIPKQNGTAANESASCPPAVAEVECGQAMAATTPVFTGSDGCPRKCRSTPKCAGNETVFVECSTIATTRQWADNGCNYACATASTPAGAEEQPGGAGGSEEGSGSTYYGGGGNGETGGSGGEPPGGGGESCTSSSVDYSVRVVTSGTTCTQNQQIPSPFLVIVKNNGGVVGPSFEYQAWLNSNPHPTHTHSGLAPCEEQLIVNLQPVCQSGSTTFYAVVDPNGLITESDESNNAASATLNAQ